MIEIEGEVGQLQERNRMFFLVFLGPYSSIYINMCVCVLCTGRKKERKEKKKKEKKRKKKKKKREKKKIRNWVGFYNF